MCISMSTGANPSIKNFDMMKPYELAKDTECQAFLRQAGEYTSKTYSYIETSLIWKPPFPSQLSGKLNIRKNKSFSIYM